MISLKSDMRSPKLLILGIDGGTFDLVLPWVEQGKLPNLARLIDEGTYGSLDSTIMPITPNAWSTFMTGKNAGKHGIFDFYALIDGHYDFCRTNGGDRKCKSIWKMLSNSGKRVGVFNMPFTYPPEDVNGFVISGFDALELNEKMSNPPTLYREIVRELGEFSFWSPRKIFGKYRIDDIDNIIENRTEVSKYLLKKNSLDLFAMVFNTVDKVQHILWKERSLQNGTRKLDDAVLYAYQRVDESIGEIIELAQDSTVLIVSDHGAGEAKRHMSLNCWLEQNGFLRFNNRNGGLRSRLSSVYGNMMIGGNAIFTKCLPYSIVDKIMRSPIRQLLMQILLNKLPRKQTFSYIDFSGTKAFSWEPWGYGNIQINVKGVFPQGIVEPGKEYEQLRDVIIERLSKLKDPDSGDPIIDRVYRREELYHGDFAHMAPDLIVVPHNYAVFTADFLGFPAEKVFFDEKDARLLRMVDWAGVHRQSGMFIACGKNIKRGKRLQGLKIEDMAPTILHLMGEKVPDDMDGRVLEEIFSD